MLLKAIGIGDNVVDCNYTWGEMYPGGNAVNFAVYSRRLGHYAAYLGVFGDDYEAQIIKKALLSEGVDISKCVIRKGETGKCAIHLIDGERIIEDENDGGVVKSQPLKITPELVDYIKTFDIAHSSCYSYIDDQLHLIKESGVTLLYDFSDTWTNRIFESICPNIDIAFFSGKDVSDSELRDLLATCVNDFGCMLAVTTAGERGAIVYNGTNFYTKSPYNFEGGAIDTTGAGDSWIASFILNYLEGKKLIENLKQGSPSNFIKEENERDFLDNCIRYSMCAGNLLARRNVLARGSFGYGVKLDSV